MVIRKKFHDFGVGKEEPALVVAEISGNHGGSLDTAKELIYEAKRAGAGAVKFQTYTPDSLAIDVVNNFFRLPKDSPWNEYRNSYSLYQEAFTPWEWFKDLFEVAEVNQLLAFSSPFDEEAVDFLEHLECPIYKLASPEITHIPLIEKIASTGKPIIISLGVASRDELEEALGVFRTNSDAEFALLICETAYPADLRNSNLALIQHLVKEYDCIVGISDHTIGHEIAPIAVGAGAKIFEKHLVLPTKVTPDSHFSATTNGLSQYVESIRNSETALGKAIFRTADGARASNPNGRSIFATRDIRKGDRFDKSNVRCVRPGHGLHPRHWKDVLGAVSPRNISRGLPINLGDVEVSGVKEIPELNYSRLWSRHNIYDVHSSASAPQWPNEFLVKLLSSTLYSDIPLQRLNQKAKVLEVGIFAGNNARLLHNLGYSIYGVEINTEMVDFSKEACEKLEIPFLDILEGSNVNLPFSSNFFDLLVSINTLHYSNSGENMKAITEFARVTKVGGFCVIETPTPEHYIVRQSQRIENLRYIWRAGGFRDGQEMGFHDNQDSLEESLQGYFTKVEILKREEMFSNLPLSWWVAVCQK